MALGTSFMNTPRLNTGIEPHPVDVHVGKCIRFRRSQLSMSQSVLAERLGITFQQVQKYERGVNRISASKLFDTARALGVPIKYFFEELEGGEKENTTNSIPEHVAIYASQPDAHRVIRAMAEIPNPIRSRIATLIKTIALDYTGELSLSEPDRETASASHS